MCILVFGWSSKWICLQYTSLARDLGPPAVALVQLVAEQLFWSPFFAYNVQGRLMQVLVLASCPSSNPRAVQLGITVVFSCAHLLRPPYTDDRLHRQLQLGTREKAQLLSLCLVIHALSLCLVIQHAQCSAVRNTCN